MPDNALNEVRFAALTEIFAPLSDKIALAVSGGPDSMALAVLASKARAQPWAQKTCVALIVDHGLRPESASEAILVRNRLDQLGLPSEILRWEHGPVTGRIHEKARAARYRLLIDACLRLGAGDLLTAHHREDQAETILMRLSRGSGIDGLAGMSPISQRGPVRILRPFLALSKQSLVKVCEAAQLPYVTDPSNMSDKFARARLRKIMPLLAAEGMTIESLLSLGDRAAEAASALDHYARAFLAEAAHAEIGGSAHIDRAALTALPRAVAARALSLCLHYIHAADYPPERDNVAALLDAAAQPEETARSLYGCLVSIGGKSIAVLREPVAAREKTPISAGQTILWDGRWQVTLDSDYGDKDYGDDTYIGALGHGPHEQVDLLAPSLRRHIPQGRIRASLPALWRGARLCAIPAFDPTAPFRLCYHKRSFP